MKKKEIINKIISMLTIFALIIPIASQVKAADPVKGIEKSMQIVLNWIKL